MTDKLVTTSFLFDKETANDKVHIFNADGFNGILENTNRSPVNIGSTNRLSVVTPTLSFKNSKITDVFELFHSSFDNGSASGLPHRLTSMASFVTSDPREVTFNSSLNVSDQLQVPEGCVVLPVPDFLPWDNPDNLISREVEQMFDMIVAVVFLNILYLIRCVCVCVCCLLYTSDAADDC